MPPTGKKLAGMPSRPIPPPGRASGTSKNLKGEGAKAALLGGAGGAAYAMEDEEEEEDEDEDEEESEEAQVCWSVVFTFLPVILEIVGEFAGEAFESVSSACHTLCMPTRATIASNRLHAAPRTLVDCTRR